MKVPARKRGNRTEFNAVGGLVDASMKVPTQRRGNLRICWTSGPSHPRLNESPHPRRQRNMPMIPPTVMSAVPQ